MDEHSALSEELVLSEDTVDATENPPELIAFSDCNCMFMRRGYNFIMAGDRNSVNRPNTW